MFQQFSSHFISFFRRIGYCIGIMADQKQPEFLGGGPKFNSVGKDNRPASGDEEPMVAPNQTGYWVRVSAIALVVLVLAGVLFYLNDQGAGKAAAHGGRAVSPDAKNAPVPANLR